MSVSESPTGRAIPSGVRAPNVAAYMDEHLRIGDVYILTNLNSDVRTTFRVLHRNINLDRAWVIQLPTIGNGSSHTKAPTEIPLTELMQLFVEKKIERIDLTPNPIFMRSDAEIRAKFTDSNGCCTLIERRDQRYAILAELINHHSTGEILERGLATSWVKTQAVMSKRSRAKLYNDLHTYWAGNFSKNALLPNFWRCGGRGKEREQRRTLGRPNATATSVNNSDGGYFLADDDKEKLSYGWKYFLSEGRTRNQAYLETMAVFYSERWETKDGIPIPILLSPEHRPTEAQFARWGPAGDPRLAASRIQLGEIDWQKKYRGISGSALDGVIAVGMQAVCDTTTNDAYLKSVTSRIKTVGPVNRLLITESRSNLIIGLHCSFEPPSARTFLLAVLQGASSKVDFCARFGIAVSEEEWPASAALSYHGDNGEYRNELSRQALDQFGSSIDNIPSGQPQFNGVAETKHHVLHARLDHQLDGTTHGKLRPRGKPHPAINACVNYFEYMRELIREILYHNNVERVSHLLNAEMRRANVKPTRISIYYWLIEQGYVVDFVPNLTMLRAHLCPSLPATLTESGIYLLREDQGKSGERIPNARYMADYLVEAGLLEQARKKGNSRITVRGDPTDLRSMWLQTERGLIELKNINPDPILHVQGTIADLISIKNDDKIAELENRGENEQQRVTIITERNAMLRHAQTEKEKEIDSLPKPMSKADHYKELGKNRQEETARIKATPWQFEKKSYTAGPSNRTVDAAKNLDNKSDSCLPTGTEHKESGEVPDEKFIDPALKALKLFMRKKQ